jgi:hypothetical protein
MDKINIGLLKILNFYIINLENHFHFYYYFKIIHLMKLHKLINIHYLMKLLIIITNFAKKKSLKLSPILQVMYNHKFIAIVL